MLFFYAFIFFLHFQHISRKHLRLNTKALSIQVRDHEINSRISLDTRINFKYMYFARKKEN